VIFNFRVSPFLPIFAQTIAYSVMKIHMKHTYLILFILFAGLSAQAQNNTLSPLARLSDRARLFGERIPQEKVYVHMDNTGYFLGDTIWLLPTHGAQTRDDRAA